MSQIDLAVELYSLMADRCEASGLSPEQARIYREMAELCSKCSDIDEATARIKNSKYYLAPTEALVRDRIGAQIKAAEKNCMPEVVEVYKSKLSAISNDQGEIYTAGYETSAQNIKKEYLLTVQAFAECFRCHYSYLVDGEETYINELKYNLANISKPTSDFKALSEIPRFRELVSFDDKAYEKFVDDVLDLISGKSLHRSSDIFPVEALENPQQAWSSVKENRDKILERGKSVVFYANKKKALAIAPTIEEYNAAIEQGLMPQYKYEEASK